MNRRSFFGLIGAAVLSAGARIYAPSALVSAHTPPKITRHRRTMMDLARATDPDRTAAIIAIMGRRNDLIDPLPVGKLWHLDPPTC